MTTASAEQRPIGILHGCCIDGKWPYRELVRSDSAGMAQEGASVGGSEGEDETEVKKPMQERAQELEAALLHVARLAKGRVREVELWRKLDTARKEQRELSEAVRTIEAEYQQLYAAQYTGALAPPPTLLAHGRQLRLVTFQQLNYPGGWVCDVCGQSMYTLSPLYHEGAVGSIYDNGIRQAWPTVTHCLLNLEPSVRQLLNRVR